MEQTVVNTTAPIVGAEPTITTQQAAVPTTPAQADKAARFKEKAEAQASKVIAEIEKLQKLSNRKYYAYSVEQVEELFNALYVEMSETEQLFTAGTVEKKKLFTFSA